MKWLAAVLWVGAVLGMVSTVNASFLIRGGTGSDGWRLPPVENTAGRSLMKSVVVGSLENPKYYAITFERVEIATEDANDPNAVCEVWDGFGGMLWVGDPLGLLDPNDPNRPTEAPIIYESATNPVRAMRTWCIVHTSEESMRLHPTMGDPNLSEELKLVISAPGKMKAGQKQLYYVRYHWPRRNVKPGVYYRALVTQTTGTLCGWAESVIHLNEGMLLTSDSPGQVECYSADRVKYPTASPAIDVYGYVLGKPMLIRNAIGDLNLDPNVPSEQRVFAPGGISMMLRENRLGGNATGIQLHPAEKATIVGFQWIAVKFDVEILSWSLAVMIEDANSSAEAQFKRSPFQGNGENYVLNVSETVIGQSPSQIGTGTVRLCSTECNLPLGTDRLVLSPFSVGRPLKLSTASDSCLSSVAWLPEGDLIGLKGYGSWSPGRTYRDWAASFGAADSGNATFDIWAIIQPSYGEAELARLTANWLRTDASPANDWLNNADLNRDGRVDHEDYEILAIDWNGTLPWVELGLNP